jgi:hypothetical protein
MASYSKGLGLRVSGASPIGVEHNKTVGITLNKKQALALLEATNRFITDPDSNKMIITVHKTSVNEDGMHTTVISG